MSNYSSRRDFIKTLLLGFGALSVPVAFSGCDDDNDDTPAVVADFLHGVASGDPLHNSVIL